MLTTTEKVKGVKCFICGAKPLKRPYSRLQVIYPYGTEISVIVCKECSKRYSYIQVELGNPSVVYLPIPKHK